MKENAWIDVTIAITNDMVTWPGDKKVRISRSSSIGVDGAVANVTSLSLSAHTGTHIDAPLHFVANGTDIAGLQLSNLIGLAKVFHIHDQQKISFNEVKSFDIKPGDRLLFRTRNSEIDWQLKPFMDEYVYLASDAARYLVENGVSCIGVDYLSVAGEENGTEVHQLLLNSGVTIIEGLDLRSTEAGVYEMIALPMKITGSDGAPARVVLRKSD